MEWWLRSRKFVPKAVPRRFDSLFFLVGWLIWKERSARTFDGQSSSAAQLVQKIVGEGAGGFQGP